MQLGSADGTSWFKLTLPCKGRPPKLFVSPLMHSWCYAMIWHSLLPNLAREGRLSCGCAVVECGLWDVYCIYVRLLVVYCWWSMSSVWCDSWPDWRCAVRNVLVSATTDQPDCGAAAPAPAGVLNSCNVVDRSSMNGPLLCNLSSARKKDSVSGKRCCKGERSLSGIHESDLVFVLVLQLYSSTVLKYLQ